MKATLLRRRGTINGRLYLTISALAVVVGLGGLLTACGDTVTSVTTVSTTSATSAVTAATAMSTSTSVVTTAGAMITTATTAPQMAIVQSMNVPYMTRASEQIPALVDVYAPKQAGPWPLVVMLHGGGLERWWYAKWAVEAARRGAVVFVPEWSRTNSDFSDLTPEELRALVSAQIGDIATLVLFARATAAQYGGDSGNLTLFGHSAGAMEAAMEALGGASASAGGLEGAGSTIPESLVLFDPDYLCATNPPWDAVLAADPGLMQLQATWCCPSRQVDFPITVIGSGDPGLSRELGDPWAEDSWFAVRDPSGDIRTELEKLGALSGDLFTNESIEQLFVERLKADGNTVTYIRLTDSTHTNLGPDGLENVVDALVPNSRP